MDEVSGEAPSRANQGMVLVYTGAGKGKTTAALGIVFRALGHGHPVAVVQFIKGKWKTGERLFAATLPQLTFHVMGLGFTWESDDLSRDRRAAESAWAEAKRLIESGEHRVVVLDELTYVIHYGFVPVEDVVQTLDLRPKHVHVVITGRNASPELLEVADLITEMKSLRHPFEKGIRAQQGIDF